MVSVDKNGVPDIAATYLCLVFNVALIVNIKHTVCTVCLASIAFLSPSSEECSGEKKSDSERF
jgi:hypothetical protein